MELFEEFDLNKSDSSQDKTSKKNPQFYAIGELNTAEKYCKLEEKVKKSISEISRNIFFRKSVHW